MKDGKEIMCDACGRNMTTLDGDHLIGTHITPARNPKIAKASENQWAPYEHKEYHICWACTLEHLGVPLPTNIEQEIPDLTEEDDF